MKYLILGSLLFLSACATRFGGVKRVPYVPQNEPTTEYFDALCTDGENGFKAHLDLALFHITHDYYSLMKQGESYNLKKQECFLEQITREPFYFFPNTELFFAQCKFNNKVVFKEINLIIKHDAINYKKVQRVLDGKTWLLSEDKCTFYKQKSLIPYESLIKKQD